MSKKHRSDAGVASLAHERILPRLRDHAVIGLMVYTFARINACAPDESA